MVSIFIIAEITAGCEVYCRKGLGNVPAGFQAMNDLRHAADADPFVSNRRFEIDGLILNFSGVR